MSQLLLNKTRGGHSYTPEMLICESCGRRNVISMNRSNNHKKFCEDCIKMRRKEQQEKHLKKYKRINLTEEEIIYLNENQINLSKLIHAVLKKEMQK